MGREWQLLGIPVLEMDGHPGQTPRGSLAVEVDGHSLWTCAFVSLLDLFSNSLVLRVHPNQAGGHWCGVGTGTGLLCRASAGACTQLWVPR